MNIDIPDNIIEQMIKEQVENKVKHRIKEMQGNYTSKGYIEELIRDVVWDKITEICPDIEIYIRSEVKRCIECIFEKVDFTKTNKKQLVEMVVDGLLDNLLKENERR